MKSVGDDTDRSRERLNCPLKTPCYTFPCPFGHSLAYQVNNWYGSFGPSGLACGGTVKSPTPCDDASYLEMMQQGIYPLGPTNSSTLAIHRSLGHQCGHFYERYLAGAPGIVCSALSDEMTHHHRTIGIGNAARFLRLTHPAESALGLLAVVIWRVALV
jgi:hypothetical protein